MTTMPPWILKPFTWLLWPFSCVFHLIVIHLTLGTLILMSLVLWRQEGKALLREAWFFYREELLEACQLERFGS